MQGCLLHVHTFNTDTVLVCTCALTLIANMPYVIFKWWEHCKIVTTHSFSLSLTPFLLHTPLPPPPHPPPLRHDQIWNGPASTWGLWYASSAPEFTEGWACTCLKFALSTWISGTRQASTSCSPRETTSQTATTRQTSEMASLKQTLKDLRPTLQSELVASSHASRNMLPKKPSS